ncbi:hypothetical protein ACXR0O_02585 [Verrucomicrobiota bacterium sgz303538]
MKALLHTLCVARLRLLFGGGATAYLGFILLICFAGLPIGAPGEQP